MTGKDLLAWGFESGPVMGKTLDIVRKAYKHSDIETVRTILEGVLATPEDFVEDSILGPIAELLIPTNEILPHEDIVYYHKKH